VRDLKTIITVALLALVVLFAVQNAVVVDVRFLFWDFPMPRVFLVALLLGVGFVIGFLAARVSGRRRR
jgi:uncharacterized integral membrane protein